MSTQYAKFLFWPVITCTIALLFLHFILLKVKIGSNVDSGIHHPNILESTWPLFYSLEISSGPNNKYNYCPLNYWHDAIFMMRENTMFTQYSKFLYTLSFLYRSLWLYGEYGTHATLMMLKCLCSSYMEGSLLKKHGLCLDKWWSFWPLAR